MRGPSRHEGDGALPLIDRRRFLQLVGATALTVATAACAKPKRAAIGPVSLRAVTTEVAERSQPGLNVFQGGGEFLAGKQRFAFGLGVGGSTEQIEGGAPRLWLARGKQLSGPVNAEFKRYVAPGDGDPAGFYVAELDIPEGGGVVDLLVETKDRYGFVAIIPREEPTVPGPGAKAVAVRTPTLGRPSGVAKICTRRPPCPMHTSSLHEAVGKQPIVFTIASPLLCTSRTCGPVLEEVLAVRSSMGTAATFIHVEPYAGDTATMLSPTAVRWRIESEPWTFVIGKDGRVAARFEGPVVASDIEAALRALPAG